MIWILYFLSVFCSNFEFGHVAFHCMFNISTMYYVIFNNVFILESLFLTVYELKKSYEYFLYYQCNLCRWGCSTSYNEALRKQDFILLWSTEKDWPKERKNFDRMKVSFTRYRERIKHTGSQDKWVSRSVSAPLEHNRGGDVSHRRGNNIIKQSRRKKENKRFGHHRTYCS